MSLRSFNSHHNQIDRQILDRLNRSILALKLKRLKQSKLLELTAADLTIHRLFLIEFLVNLYYAVRFLTSEQTTNVDDLNVDLSYLGLANRFFLSFQHDIEGNLANLMEVREFLQTSDSDLSPEDFDYLDRLQGILEDDVDGAVRGLYTL